MQTTSLARAYDGNKIEEETLENLVDSCDRKTHASHAYDLTSTHTYHTDSQAPILSVLALYIRWLCALQSHIQMCAATMDKTRCFGFVVCWFLYPKYRLDCVLRRLTLQLNCCL